MTTNILREHSGIAEPTEVHESADRMKEKNRESRKTQLARELKREGTLLAQLASLTKANSFDTTYLTHGIHPYPAKYIPQLPNLIIREHTNERNTVLDPFCGSGTTLLEASLLGRKSIGIDCNPIATLITRAKTSALTLAELVLLEALASSVPERLTKRAVPTSTPENVRHWFQDSAILELTYLRRRIFSLPTVNARDFASCVFSSIIVLASNQESETRYAAIDKDQKPGDCLLRFRQKLTRELINARKLAAISNAVRNPPIVRTADLRNRKATRLTPESIDLVVTSPPYANSFDYYLYHKWRMYWLQCDIDQTRDSEIGSRREHSSLRASIDVFVDKMAAALAPVAASLKPSKLAYFFVGDAVIAGQFFDARETFARILQRLPLRAVADTSYSLESVSRSFHEKKSKNCHGGLRDTRKMQRILVYERIRDRKRRVTSDRSLASPNATRSQVPLCGPVKSGSTIAVSSDESNRHIHALGRYPSRFIPEVPQWAIRNYSQPGDTVLDPFVGSGTTAVEALLSGRHSIAMDVSPYSALLTRAKTIRPTAQALQRAATTVVDKLSSPLPTPSSAVLDYPLLDFWFPQRAVSEILGVRQLIEDSVPAPLRVFFLAVLSTTIRPASYQDEGQIKVKRDPKKVLHGTPNPRALMIAALSRNVRRKLDFLARADKSVRSKVLCRGASSVSKEVAAGSIDLVVTSPPYINAMNYPMTHRSENFLLGLVDPRESVKHDEQYVGTERVYSKDYGELRTLGHDFDQVVTTNALLAKIFRSEPKRSYIAYQYFDRMWAILGQLSSRLRANGSLVLVVGGNTIRGVAIDTFSILSSMLEAHGLKQESHFYYEIIRNSFKLTRHRTASIIPHDGVVVLRKAR